MKILILRNYDSRQDITIGIFHDSSVDMAVNELFTLHGVMGAGPNSRIVGGMPYRFDFEYELIVQDIEIDKLYSAGILAEPQEF